MLTKVSSNPNHSLFSNSAMGSDKCRAEDTFPAWTLSPLCVTGPSGVALPALSPSGLLCRFHHSVTSSSPAAGLWLLTILIPAKARNRIPFQVIGLDNWEWKCTEVSTTSSPSCSFISTELQGKGVQKTVLCPSQDSWPAAHPSLNSSWSALTATRNSLHPQLPSPGEDLNELLEGAKQQGSVTGRFSGCPARRHQDQTQLLLRSAKRQKASFLEEQS